MGKSVDIPDYEPPDPREIMETEAEYNRYNTTNPFGTTSWARDPETNRWSQEVKLAPEYEQLRRQQFNRQAAGLVRNPFANLNDQAPGVARIMSGAMQRVGERYNGGQGGGNKPPAFQPEPLPQLPEDYTQEGSGVAPVFGRGGASGYQTGRNAGRVFNTTSPVDELNQGG